MKTATAWVGPRWDTTHTIRTRAGEVTAIDYRGVQAAFGLGLRECDVEGRPLHQRRR